jgi:hypothetical protein
VICAIRESCIRVVFMDLHLSRKVFIVAAGAKGIGHTICELLTSEGAHAMAETKQILGENAIRFYHL